MGYWYQCYSDDVSSDFEWGNKKRRNLGSLLGLNGISILMQVYSMHDWSRIYFYSSSALQGQQLFQYLVKIKIQEPVQWNVLTFYFISFHIHDCDERFTVFFRGSTRIEFHHKAISVRFLWWSFLYRFFFSSAAQELKIRSRSWKGKSKRIVIIEKQGGGRESRRKGRESEERRGRGGGKGRGRRSGLKSCWSRCRME